MKSVRIDIKNHAASATVIDARKGSTSKHILKTAEIVTLAEEAERQLGLLVLKKDSPGARVLALSGRPVANACRHKRLGNQATLERKRSGWYLTDLRVCRLQVSQGRTIELQLTPAQDKTAVTRLRRGYRIRIEDARDE